MENLFEWSSKYSVGNETIDSQHEQLFELGKKMVIDGNTDISQLMDTLYQYAKDHFETEEEHMRSISFPELEAHRQLHKELLTDLKKILKKGVKSDKDIDRAKNFFLCWLLDHVMMQDMKYFNYARGN